MKSPTSTVDFVQNAREVGRKILEALQEAVTTLPGLLSPCRARFEGSDTEGFESNELAYARSLVFKALEAPEPPAATGLCKDLIAAYIARSGDPDTDLVK